MMSKSMISLIAATAMLLPAVLQAAPPMVSQQQALGSSVQCPSMIEGLTLERIKNFTPPSGWRDNPSMYGGYSGVGLMVNAHRMSVNGKSMVCGYGTKSPAYTLIWIVKSVPGNRTCSKGSNYSFSCKIKVPRLRR